MTGRLRALANRIAAMFGRRDAGLDDELRAHIEMAVEENRRLGMSDETARQTALRSFGGVTQTRERFREQEGLLWLENLRRDAAYALRQMRRSPGFTAVVVVTLALGIGANTGIFTLTRSLLLRPLPVQQPNRLVRISLVLNNPGGAVRDMPLNSFMIDSLRRHSRTLSGIFGWCQYFFVLKEDIGLRVYDGAMVTGNTFAVLGLRPAEGRLLTPDDDRPGGGPDGWAAVISYRFWRQHFGGDPSVVGSHVTLSDHSVTIVGVAPQGFDGVLVDAQPDFYLPANYEPVLRGAGSLLNQRGSLWLMAWARLVPGVSRQAAAAEIRTLFRPTIDETLPAAMRHVPVVEHAGFSLESGATGWSGLRSTYTRPLLLLQILVGVVLLVCCVNLAGLCLARVSTREHEFAIRSALGSARGRLMRQILVESLLPALAGGALAVAFAWLIDRYFLQFLGNREAAAALAMRPDPGMLAITGACAVACALLFGIAPAWLATQFPADAALRTTRGSQSTGSKRSFLLRRLSLPAQLALTLGLVAVAAMLSATVRHLRNNSTGFRTAGIVLFNTDFERLPQKGEDLFRLYRRMLARLSELPGVENVSVAENTPLSGRSHLGAFFTERSPEASANPFRYETNTVSSGYFATLGVRFLAGRDFSGGDADAGACIVNQTAMNMLFPMMPALGGTLHQHLSSMSTGTAYTEDCRVIGVVADTRLTSLRDAAPPVVYLPLTAKSGQLYSLTFVIRARTLAEGQAAYAKTLHELAPASPLTDPVALSEQFDRSIARESLLAALSNFFAGLALLLSGIGIYGLSASWVARRVPEIGVRMAVGATRVQIVVLVLRQIAVLLTVGALCGAAIASLAGRAIRAWLYGIDATSPALLALAVAMLILTTLLAAWLPARRAASVDPMQALRAE